MGCKTVFGMEYKDIWCTGILTSKYLLILDNTPVHNTESLQFNHPSIEVMFYLVNNTTLQPVDRGFIKICLIILKLYKSIWCKPLTGVSDNLEQFWKVENEDCIDVITMTWDEMKIFTMNACWKYLSPDVANNLMAIWRCTHRASYCSVYTSRPTRCTNSYEPLLSFSYYQPDVPAYTIAIQLQKTSLLMMNSRVWNM